MTPWLDDGDVRLYHGDALEQLALMPSESVQCIVTSPPFYALRDYGVDGQIGLESTVEEWCERLVGVFREARRVLRSDGVMWLEVGDAYNTSPPGNKPGTTAASSGLPNSMENQEMRRAGHSRGLLTSVKPKDMLGCPWLLAFALRADGWYLRSDTIWARPNPMPESVTDRPTKAHSYVFLLTKSARYFYDADSIRETSIRAGERAGGDPMRGQEDNGHVKPSWGHGEVPAARNARSVWTIATEPTPFAHFATFPQALVERCIKAGTSEHGACSECGAPWRRITEQRETVGSLRTPNTTRNAMGGGNEAKTWRPAETLGWEPSCAHDAPVTPCLVLDCFMGSGTSALVARKLGRHAIGIELNAEYLEISAKRLQQLSLFSTTGADAPSL